jgi:predicted amidophosphoribosyltransferase
MTAPDINPQTDARTPRLSLRHWWREAALDALALALPTQCAGCGVDDRLVCTDCRNQLVPQLRARELWREGHVALPLYFGLNYEPPVSGLLHALKEAGATAVTPPLAAALRQVIAEVLPTLTRPDPTKAARRPPVWVTPPSTSASYRARGYVPVTLLARRAGVAPQPLLRQAQARRDQAELGRDERFDNMAGTLVATPLARGASVILLDDVATSGATLFEAARALREGGATVLAAVTLAHTPVHKKLSENSQTQTGAKPR